MNRRKASNYFEAVADQKFTFAQRSYGICFLNDGGVSMNQQETSKTFKLAADLGLDHAPYRHAPCL
jgi:TPR repeat protein